MKKVKRNTFSNAPSWYNKRQKANYERDKRLMQLDINFVERMSKYSIYGFQRIETLWVCTEGMLL